VILILAALLHANAFKDYAGTPQAAAKIVFSAPPGLRLTVERTNVAGRYAAVLIRGGALEGTPIHVPILVERFSFGWQPLDLIDARCSLRYRPISTRQKALLLRGMPAPDTSHPCDKRIDSGPPAQIEAVRMLIYGPLVPYVAVRGIYAKGDWGGNGGGEILFRYSGKKWRVLAGGGGAMGTATMVEFGVPESYWCALRIYDAQCDLRPHRKPSRPPNNGQAH